MEGDQGPAVQISSLSGSELQRSFLLTIQRLKTEYDALMGLDVVALSDGSTTFNLPDYRGRGQPQPDGRQHLRRARASGRVVLVNTLACGACGAKFQHDGARMICKRCGIPDEVLQAGQRAVMLWKRKPNKLRRVEALGMTLSKRERKRLMHRHPARRPRMKHGRQVATS